MIKVDGRKRGTRRGLSRTARGAAFVVSALLGAASARAATVNTWSGAVGTGWDNGGNWSQGSKPTSGQDVIFPVGPIGGFSANLTSGEQAGTLEFDNSYTLTSGSLTVNNGTINVASGATATINSALTGGVT